MTKKRGSFAPVPYERDISFISADRLNAVRFRWECPCCGDPCTETILYVQSVHDEKLRILEDARCVDCRLTKSRTARSDEPAEPFTEDERQ